MSWTEQPIYFVDFEGNRSSGILEFGVVTLIRGKIEETRTQLCKPVGRIQRAETAVHGLAEQQVASAQPFADEWEYFAGLRDRGPLAAHYAGAENSLLKSVWPYPRSAPDFARPGEQVIDWGPWIDTGRVYAQLYPNLESGRLESLIVLCGLTGQLDTLASRHCPEHRRHFHAALYDALAGALLLAALASDPQVAGLSTMQLLALSTLDPVKRDALRQPELF